MSCHALTYLFLAAKNQIPVIGYRDDTEGQLGPVDGKIQMSRVTLRPLITLESGANEARARALVAKAHESCFIANSVATPVDVVPAFAFAEVAGRRVRTRADAAPLMHAIHAGERCAEENTCAFTRS